MFRLKACPKCGGDQIREDEWVCLQCGWREPIKATAQLPYVHPQTWMYKGEVTR